jgi:carboxypeptidase PM20D1
MQHPTDIMIKLLANELRGITRFALKRPRLFRKRILKELSKNQGTNALIRTVMSPTMISGGVKENALPTHASANIQCAHHPG